MLKLKNNLKKCINNDVIINISFSLCFLSIIVEKFSFFEDRLFFYLYSQQQEWNTLKIYKKGIKKIENIDNINIIEYQDNSRIIIENDENI